LSFFDELKRRNVIRVAGLYVVGSWLIAQVATTILPHFKPLAWLVPIVLIVLAIGFVPALLFAWAFEITPEGLKREHQVRRDESIAHLTGKQLDRIIIVVLALALGYFAFDKFVLSPAREQVLALEIDSSYAPAWTVLAYCYRRQANNGMRPIEEGYSLARDALRRALAIDAEYPRAYAELGRVAFDYENDVAVAAGQLERALALDPSNADVLGYSALVAVDIGRFDLASALNQRALELDPLNPTLHNSVGFALRFSARLDEAIAEYRKVLELSPHIIGTRYRIGETLLLKSEPAAALAEIQNEPSEAWKLTGLALAHHSLGHAKEADAGTTLLLTSFLRASIRIRVGCH
jgi:tetratricopeptide (TPR) repeat protein